MVDRTAVQTAVRVKRVLRRRVAVRRGAARRRALLAPVRRPPRRGRVRREGRREVPVPRGRRIPPGPEDADLGFGELVEERTALHPAADASSPQSRTQARLARRCGGGSRPVRRRGARGPRRRGSLSDDERARTVSRLTSEASIVAGRPVTIRCDEQYAFTGARATLSGSRFRRRRSRTSTRASAARSTTSCATGRNAVNARARGSSSSPTRPSTSAGSGVEGVTECLALKEEFGSRFGSVSTSRGRGR